MAKSIHFRSRRSAVMARHGMVATMAGGNAADAAVTVAAMLNVVEPGGLFLWNPLMQKR